MTIDLPINSTRVFRTLLVFAAVVLVGHLVALFLSYGLGYTHFYGIVPFLDLDSERNVPTIFTVLLFFFAALLLGLIAAAEKKRERPFVWSWLLLALVFLFLGIDESIEIHERISYHMRSASDFSGFLYFAWLIPYTIAGGLLCLVLLRFLLQLPQATRLRFLVAGILYVGGAVGLEGVSGVIYEETGGDRNFLFSVIATFEECLEIAGLLIFIRALLYYLNEELADLRIHFRAS